MYTIDFAKKLDEGTAGVTVKGKISFNLPPKHVVSQPNAPKNFDFWSQFIVIEDKTGGIGVNISFGEEEDKKKNGDIVEVKGAIHKYEAENKRTHEKEEKIVLNKAKIIESEAEKQIKQGLKEAKEGKIEPMDKEIKKDIEDGEKAINNNYKTSSEQEIRQESAVIAFDYGAKNDFAIYDCFDLAKIIGTYIKLGEIDIKEIVKKTKPLVKKEKIEPETESKAKVEEEKTEEKQVKNNKELEKLFYKGQESGLATWVELIAFAVKKDIFPVGTSIEDARKQLLENSKDCYDLLCDSIDIREDVSNLPDDGQPTGEIPF